MARDAAASRRRSGWRARGSPSWTRRWPTGSRARCVRWARTRGCRRSSTSRATRAGGASRRPTARIPTWSQRSAWLSSRGLQDGADAPVLATGKHFVGYGLPEGGMNWAPAHIGPRELREVYLLPFEAAVREAGLRSVMNGYEELDGVPCAPRASCFTTIAARRVGLRRHRRLGLRGDRRALDARTASSATSDGRRPRARGGHRRRAALDRRLRRAAGAGARRRARRPGAGRSRGRARAGA